MKKIALCALGLFLVPFICSCNNSNDVNYNNNNPKVTEDNIESKTYKINYMFLENAIAIYDEYGNLSKDGIGAISLPDVGNKPADGYTKGSWNKEIRNKISSKDDGNEYIYTYKKLETAKADIVEPGEKGANPKTGDIFYRYIVYGGLGTLVLMTAIKIRRKYSRKARKIQF